MNLPLFLSCTALLCGFLIIKFLPAVIKDDEKLDFYRLFIFSIQLLCIIYAIFLL